MPRYAAVDIGSNSIRMQVADVVPGRPPEILAADRQVVRLGESVFRAGRFSQDALQLAVEVLSRMAQAYRKLDVAGVRAVATSAVRDAGNQREFLERASLALGSPVEVISGQEEARLIHLGVQSRWPHPKQRILILDIGGGSAELIRSEQGYMVEAYSRPLGAIRLTEVFLKSDPPTSRELHQMEQYIEERIASAVRRLGRRVFDRAIATSATAAAVVSAINRVARTRREDADRLRASTAQIRKLYHKLAARDLAARRKVPGIGPRRAEIIVPGAALLLHVLQHFRLASFYYSAAGVRDGIIADLAARGVGRELSRLGRDQRREVEEMARRFGVAIDHARQVAGLAHTLFDSLQPLHQLSMPAGRLLEAAAYLHDIGHFVNDTAHHKHSFYLVANSDMAGFTDRERLIIANLCRYHRKALPSEDHDHFNSLATDEKKAIRLLTPLLRLADALDRSHEQRVESLYCELRDSQVLLRVGSRYDTDLELWAGERAAEVFRQIYQHPVAVQRVKP